VAAALLLLMLIGCVQAWAQQAECVDPAEVIVKMEESNSTRRNGLEFCRSMRRYQAGNTRLNRQGSMLVEMSQSVPGQKTFHVIERNGSRIIQSRVIEPIIDAERESSDRNGRRDADISRRNYSFTYAGRDSDSDAYIFVAQPVKPNKYLFRGRIWIDARDFAIRRIEGEPARSPSFWVRRTHFVHEYASFGDFWFPVSNITEAELRIFGRSQLKIEYFGYEWLPLNVVGESREQDHEDPSKGSVLRVAGAGYAGR
jgi:hypothetical protein